MYFHEADVKEEEKTLEHDRGILYSVAHALTQPGKTCTVFDGGDITICVLKLDTPFGGDPWTKEYVWGTGMQMKMNFSHSLRVATDGTVKVFWISNTPPVEEKP